MPDMRKEGITPPVNLDVANLNVAIDPVTAGTVKERYWEITGEVTLPAGAYSIHVRHVDFNANGSQATINGQDIGYNRFYERSVREDLVTKKQDFTPEVTILNPDGVRLAISVSYPSSSPVNPDLL